MQMTEIFRDPGTARHCKSESRRERALREREESERRGRRGEDVPWSQTQMWLDLRVCVYTSICTYVCNLYIHMYIYIYIYIFIYLLIYLFVCLFVCCLYIHNDWDILRDFVVMAPVGSWDILGLHAAFPVISSISSGSFGFLKWGYPQTIHLNCPFQTIQ